MSEVYEDLSKFAAEPDFVTKMNVAFGENWDAAGGKALAEGWFNRDFSAIPPVKLVSSAEIAGANGAFAAATDTIYLSKEFLTQNGANPAAVADVLLEEIGHSVDSLLNVTDSPGDEGAIFSRVVQGKELSQGELQRLKGEDDHGTALFNGQTISIEKADTYDWGNRWYVQAFDTANSYKSLTQYDLGSNTRNDGKKGLVQDWGSGSPKPGIIPNDFFALAFWTQADFQQGQTYNFNVRADDSYALAALPVGAQNSNQWEFITQWKWNEDAYGGKTVQFTPKNSGKYWVLEYYRERDGNAYFDTSWEAQSPTINPSDLKGTVTKDGETEPVSLKRVGGDGSSTDSTDIKNRPTWVVIHGMNNSPETDSIKALSKAINDYKTDDQVLVLDWSKEAFSDSQLKIPTTDKYAPNPIFGASWISTVADWTKKKLVDEWKISPENINFAGHSLGSYLAWETAKDIGGVNKLIALDPARTTNGGYPSEDKVNFSNYSKWSWAFYGSLLGNYDRANTAEESFQFHFPSLINPIDKHGAVVTAFADTIKQNKKQPGYFTGLLNLDKMNASADQPWKRGNGFEATLVVNQNNNNEWVISDGESRLRTNFGNALIAS
jgi:pimeloyl-ACP methyl ester carboxylesterase